MNEKRFGSCVFIAGIVLAWGMEYTIEASSPLPLPPGSITRRMPAFNTLLAVTLSSLTVLGSYGINAWFRSGTMCIDRPSLRVAALTIGTAAFSIFAGSVSVDAASRLVPNAPVAGELLWMLRILGCSISLLMSSAYTAYVFVMESESTRRESDDLRNEHLQSRFIALKSQIDPHFLFNNLNTLAGLLPDHPAAAAEFVQHLAKVYRYVLQTMEQPLVELETEVAILEAYLFILQTRFRGGFAVDIDIPAEAAHLLIAPLTLQILIENAVKHNVVSAEHPLRIGISYENDPSLLVWNTLQRKQSTETVSTHVGLQNIHRRYRFLEGRQVRIEETPGEFRVTIPLIARETQWTSSSSKMKQ